MAIEGQLFLCDRDDVGKRIKWMLWGDAQTRLDFAWSEFVLLEEIREVPAFQRVKQIIEENAMTGFGPVADTDSRFLGEKLLHACFIHPRYIDRELAQMPRMVTIPPQ